MTTHSNLETTQPTRTWRTAIEDLGPRFAERASHHDVSGEFVAENYAELAEWGVFSAGVPTELGGGGASHRELCELLRQLAWYCPSTALVLSMHTHLVAATVWKWKHQGVGEPLLRRIAHEQIGLVSTGATDWVNSNGSMEKVDGGYLVSARKVFASGSPGATLLVTSAPYDDPEEGPQVLHFPVAFDSEGVSISHDWDAHGMRGTGSHTVVFDRVFVPEEKVALRRPQNQWPNALNVVLTVAMPLILSVYRGLADHAAGLARKKTAKQPNDVEATRILGEIQNHQIAMELAANEMITLANDYDFVPSVSTASRALSCKTLATNAAIAIVEMAVTAAGGSGFYRKNELERMLRDVRAAHYHPLPEARQLQFSGRVAIGLSPVG